MLEKWRARRDEILAAMEEIVSKEERSEANTKTLSDFEAELTVLTAQINDHTRFMEARAAADMVDTRQARAAVVRQRPTDPQGDRTFAEDFIASEQFRNYHFHGTSSQVEIETRAPIATTDPVFEPLFRPAQISIAEPTISLPMFDLVTVEPVSTGSVEWVQYALDPNAAAVVPEGGVKPESGFAGTPGAATLDNWAHWVQVTRQALEDSQRLRSIIDTQMRNGVSRKVHDSISAALVAATLPTAAGDDLLSAIRVGIATVQGAGFDPNAVLLNPADWAALDLTVMAGTLSGPTQQSGFWGLRPVASPDQPAGTATVGDFKTGVRHFRRNAVSLYITDSHAETFISNVFTILAEQRAKTVVVNPNALVECAATPEAPIARSASAKAKS
jgi:HK97 family phage major capsid protein